MGKKVLTAPELIPIVWLFEENDRNTPCAFQRMAAAIPTTQDAGNSMYAFGYIFAAINTVYPSPPKNKDNLVPKKN